MRGRRCGQGSRPEDHGAAGGQRQRAGRPEGLILKTVAEVEKAKKVKLQITVGTMIECRAAITADQIAVEADFFSFGTNDLT